MQTYSYICTYFNIQSYINRMIIAVQTKTIHKYIHIYLYIHINLILNKMKASNEQQKEFLSTKEVLTCLGIHIQTLNAWNKKGKTKPYKLGRLNRYKREDIEALYKPVEVTQ